MRVEGGEWRVESVEGIAKSQNSGSLLSTLHSSLSTTPRIGIVLVNYNGYVDTVRCLKSLEDITYANIEVIVVDNGSHDGSGAR